MGAGRARPPLFPFFLFPFPFPFRFLLPFLPFLLLLLLLLPPHGDARWVATPDTVRPRLLREQVLWVSGGGPPFPGVSRHGAGGSPPFLGGVHTFRVPLLVAPPGGALLACAEGRKRSAADVGAKIIACRRSPDRGATWGPTQVVADDGWGGDGLSLGALAVLGGGEVLLLFARCAHPPQACGPPSTLLLRSPDGGRSWGPPLNLSEVVGGEVFAPGPGSGIQPYELPDGSVAVSIRNQGWYRCRCRMRARSWDGGESLSPASVTLEPDLPDPAVAAGALALPWHGLVLFSNPAHPSLRVNMTLRWSFDNGTTWWGRGLRVWAGPSGYSVLAAPPPEEEGSAPLVYLIYEKGRSLSTESVSLATISLAGEP
ncbi:sialidase-1 isoform X2 [Taeniopygia guttata]|uniref:sialidase-1 isoform X2 n=1 Tax=Taeniopygia guttata TaxID=59729 RepID=UPI003BB8F5A3